MGISCLSARVAASRVMSRRTALWMASWIRQPGFVGIVVVIALPPSISLDVDSAQILALESRGVANPTTIKRPYDASRRRERAEEERQATRLRVVESARKLF